MPAPHSSIGRTRAATAIAVAAWALAVLSVALLVVGQPPVDENLLFFLVDITVACVYGTVAAVILVRRSHPVPWLLAIAAVGGGLAAFGFAHSSALDQSTLTATDAIARLANTAWVPGTLALFLVVPWLVRDHPLRLEWVGLAAGATLSVATGVAVILDDEAPHLDEMYWCAIGLGLVTALSVAWRRRFGPAGERNGLGWLAVGTAILAVSFVPVLTTIPWLPYWLTPVLHLASQAVFPAAVLVVVLRNRLWDLQLVVSRAVLGGLLTGGLLVVYLAVTLLLGELFPGDGVPQLLAAGAVAAAVQPLRLTAGRRVRRLVYGDAADPHRVARRLGTQLVSSDSTDELLAGLTADLGESMRLESVIVVSDALAPVRWGEPSGPGAEVELRHSGELVGLLQVTALPGAQLSARDLSTLRDVASVVAAAVVIGRGAADLEELRSRLAAARLEERRVLRREIHDGLGPSLAGISLGLQGARNLLLTDSRAGYELLAHLQGEVETAANSVRGLSHHLLPPVLDELGLVPALTELAGRFDSGALHVTVEADRFDGLDPRVAAAAYGIVGEALTNVLRHSAASHCRIVARRHPVGSLLLVVADDGRGRDGDAAVGVGTRSMRERAEEQSGTLEVRDRIGGGTEVVATLPLVVTHG